MEDIICKVVLVGESGVGKTCIIKRYINNEFNPNTESTTTSTYSFKKLDFKKYKKSISFDIWDTAGQELYRSIAKNFYLNAAIGILVYDVRSKKSFDALKEYWYEQLTSYGDDNIIFGVAGNKCDLFQDEEVSEEEGKKFAESINAVFFLTSCKESVGIDQLFEGCGEKFLETNGFIENKNEKAKIVLNKKDVKVNNNDNGKKKKFC